MKRAILVIAPVFLLIAFMGYFLSSYNIVLYPKMEVSSSHEWSFLSVGLYENKTHPCAVHIITCEAEFKLTNLNYTIVSEDGAYLIKGFGKTNEKGFFDLYLPRAKNYIATFHIAGKRGSGTISTKDGSSNCITDIQVGS